MSKMTDALEEWIIQYNSGMTWFNKLDAKNTKRTYLPNLKKYCDWAKLDPDQLIQMKIEGLQSINTVKEWQAENLLETFLTTSKLKPSIKDSIRTTVISFYKNNRRPLLEIKKVNTPESKKRCPKIQDILDLENAFQTWRDKAMLWFLASAPFRVETLTKLLWCDLKPTGDVDVPFYLNIEAARLKGKGRGKYKGLKQVSFLHSLAAQKLEAYKKELERKSYSPTENDPIFIAYRKKRKCVEMSPFGIEGNFTDASLMAWHDLEEKRFSPQDFRSFVQTQLENAKVNGNVIKVITGHKPQGVDFHYSEHNIEDFRLAFKTALPYLLPQSLESLKAETEADKKKIECTVSEVEKLKDQLAATQPMLNTLYNTFGTPERLEEFLERITKIQREQLQRSKDIWNKGLKHSTKSTKQ